LHQCVLKHRDKSFQLNRSIKDVTLSTGSVRKYLQVLRYLVMHARLLQVLVAGQVRWYITSVLADVGAADL
jgi:hypothetical protein